MTLHCETGSLSATAPFDFDKSLDFIANFPPTQDEQLIEPGSITKAIAIEGHTVIFQLAGKATLEHPQLAYRLFSEQPLPASVKQAVLDRISFFLSLNDDLEPFYAIGSADPPFAPIIQQLYGLHHVKMLTLGEAGCWAVFGQRLALPIARRMKRAVIETYGSSLEVNGRVYWAFPELKQLSGVSAETFAALLKNERRAAYLSAVVSTLGTVDEAFLRTAPYAEAEA